MVLKKIVCGLADSFGCFDGYKQNIKDYRVSGEICEKRVTGLSNQLTDLVLENNSLEDKLKQHMAFNPTKVPERNILYRRNVWLGKKLGWKTMKISVRNYFTVQDDTYKQKLVDADLMIKDLDEIDSKVPEIYKLAKKKYKYINDSDYGFAEHWQFPWELDIALSKGIGGDCEDYSKKIVTMMRIAGVPGDRVFESCGYTRSGFGHSTVYVEASDLHWRHLNSTRPNYHKSTLFEYPLKEDEDDLIGIAPGMFWHSENDLLSIHAFETKEAGALFSMEPAMKRVTIV